MKRAAEGTRDHRVARCVSLAASALASAVFVEIALPKQQTITTVWVLLAHLVPFVLGTELVAGLRPEWFQRPRLPGLIQVGCFIAVFCYFVPRMFDRFIASDFDSFYYLMLTLMPMLILIFALLYRIGGGAASAVRRGSYACLLVMLSGAEDTMFWVLRGKPIPERWTWASHINVFFGHVVTRNTAFGFMGVHLVLAALILLLPDRSWAALRPARRTAVQPPATAMAPSEAPESDPARPAPGATSRAWGTAGQKLDVP